LREPNLPSFTASNRRLAQPFWNVVAHQLVRKIG
jgi:hypothetical protein